MGRGGGTQHNSTSLRSLGIVSQTILLMATASMRETWRHVAVHAVVVVNLKEVYRLDTLDHLAGLILADHII